MKRRRPRFTLFPYTTLFRSDDFMGGNGRSSDGQVLTGPFAYRTGHWPIRYGVTSEPYLTRNMTRPDRPIALPTAQELDNALDRKSTRLNSSHSSNSYADFCS